MLYKHAVELRNLEASTPPMNMPYNLGRPPRDVRKQSYTRHPKETTCAKELPRCPTNVPRASENISKAPKSFPRAPEKCPNSGPGHCKEHPEHAKMPPELPRKAKIFDIQWFPWLHEHQTSSIEKIIGAAFVPHGAAKCRPTTATTAAKRDPSISQV